MNEPHISVGVAHKVVGPETIPAAIIISMSQDGCGQFSMVITKEVARSVAKMLIGLADDMDKKTP
jgi:hypothetical protein